MLWHFAFQVIAKPRSMDLENKRTTRSSSKRQSAQKDNATEAPAEQAQQQDGNKTPENPAKESASENRPDSPEPNCSICLGKLQNKSFTDNCFHMFCFVCLLEWSKVKAVCPLCKQPFKSIIHNVRSIEDYDQYHLRSNENGSFESPDGRRFRYRTTVTFERSQARWERERQSSMQQAREMALFQRPTSTHTRVHWQRHRQVSTSAFRRRIYADGMRVREVRNKSGRPMRYRDVTPNFFRENPACTHRLVPWLNRELNVLLHNQEDRVQFVLELILDLIKRFEISGEEFREHLTSILNQRTEHFIHEFHSFASSPYDMGEYDRQAIYDEPETPASQAAVIDSSSEDDTDPDVVILSPTEGESSGFAGPIQVPRPVRPVPQQPFSYLSSLLTSQASEPPSERLQPDPMLPFNPTPLLTTIRNFFSSLDHVDTDTAHSGWESPDASSSGVWFQSTSSYLPGTSYMTASAENASMPAASTSVIDTPLDLRIKQDKRKRAAPQRESSEEDSEGDSESSEGDYSSSNDDVLVVGYDKAWVDRSPIMLSSAEDSDIEITSSTSTHVSVKKEKQKSHPRSYNDAADRHHSRRSRSRDESSHSHKSRHDEDRRRKRGHSRSHQTYRPDGHERKRSRSQDEHSSSRSQSYHIQSENAQTRHSSRSSHSHKSSKRNEHDEHSRRKSSYSDHDDRKSKKRSRSKESHHKKKSSHKHRSRSKDSDSSIHDRRHKHRKKEKSHKRRKDRHRDRSEKRQKSSGDDVIDLISPRSNGLSDTPDVQTSGQNRYVPSQGEALAAKYKKHPTGHKKSSKSANQSNLDSQGETQREDSTAGTSQSNDVVSPRSPAVTTTSAMECYYSRSDVLSDLREQTEVLDPTEGAEISSEQLSMQPQRENLQHTQPEQHMGTPLELAEIETMSQNSDIQPHMDAMHFTEGTFHQHDQETHLQEESMHGTLLQKETQQQSESVCDASTSLQETMFHQREAIDEAIDLLHQDALPPKEQLKINHDTVTCLPDENIQDTDITQKTNICPAEETEHEPAGAEAAKDDEIFLQDPAISWAEPAPEIEQMQDEVEDDPNLIQPETLQDTLLAGFPRGSPELDPSDRAVPDDKPDHGPPADDSNWQVMSMMRENSPDKADHGHATVARDSKLATKDSSEDDGVDFHCREIMAPLVHSVEVDRFETDDSGIPASSLHMLQGQQAQTCGSGDNPMDTYTLDNGEDLETSLPESFVPDTFHNAQLLGDSCSLNNHDNGDNIEKTNVLCDTATPGSQSELETSRDVLSSMEHSTYSIDSEMTMDTPAASSDLCIDNGLQ